MKIKVVYVIPSMETGGAEKLVLDLVKNFDIEKLDVSIICLYPRLNTPYEKIAEELNLNIKYLNKSKGFDFKTVKDIYRELSKIKPDIVHTHLYVFPYVFPWLLTHRKTRCVHTVHNVAEKELSRSHRKIQRIGYSILGATPVAISVQIKESICRVYGFDEENVPTILNGIDVNRFKNVDKKSKSEGFTFINVASFKEQKNHNLLIDAFAEVVKDYQDAKLVLVGDGSLRGSIEDRIKKLNIERNVVLKGITMDIPGELKEADAFVLSSDWEGLPISLLEAMAAGLPIVTTDVGGVSDIIKDGINGILVEKGNEDALVKGMKQLINNKELREKFINNNMLDSDKYDIKYVADRYCELYKEVML